jgi:glyoxylase-like metal-dependent hydrolase (beta-lactamase superfamily II)
MNQHRCCDDDKGNSSSSLGFVSDGLIGDDPEAVKDGLRTSYRRLLSLDFDGVMCAHGDPMSSGAKKALREFVG